MGADFGRLVTAPNSATAGPHTNFAGGRVREHCGEKLGGDCWVFGELRAGCCPEPSGELGVPQPQAGSVGPAQPHAVAVGPLQVSR
jgi:hypothetical protein